MIYGETGSGKTKLASTFPDPLFLVPANEGSELTLLGTDFPFVKIGRDDNGKPMAARHHMGLVLETLETRHAKMLKCYAEASATDSDDERAALEAAAVEAFPWQTIVVESLSHYCDMLVEDLSRGGTKSMDMQAWGALGSHLRSVHARLRNFDCHVVFTALAKLVEGASGGAVAGKPNITGQMADKLPSACDVIGYCETMPGGTKGAPRIFRTHFEKYKQFPARSRFPGFPKFADNFTFAQVQSHLGL